MKFRPDIRQKIIYRLETIQVDAVKKNDEELNRLFIENFHIINWPHTVDKDGAGPADEKELSIAEQNVNFKLLMHCFEIIKENIFNPDSADKIQPKVSRVAEYVYFSLILFIGVCLSILSAFGLTMGMLALMPWLFMASYTKFIIGGVISSLFSFMFIGGDFSSITRKASITFSTSGKVLDSQIKILTIISNLIKSMQDYPDLPIEKKIREALPLFSTAGDIIKKSQQITFDKHKEISRYLSIFLRVVSGVFAVGISLFGIKTGALAFFMFFGLSIGTAGMASWIAVAVGLVFFGTIYFISQQKNVNNTVSKFFSRDANKVNKVLKYLRNVTGNLHSMRHVKSDDLSAPGIVPVAAVDPHAASCQHSSVIRRRAQTSII